MSDILGKSIDVNFIGFFVVEKVQVLSFFFLPKGYLLASMVP